MLLRRCKLSLCSFKRTLTAWKQKNKPVLNLNLLCFLKFQILQVNKQKNKSCFQLFTANFHFEDGKPCLFFKLLWFTNNTSSTVCVKDDCNCCDITYLFLKCPFNTPDRFHCCHPESQITPQM